jgi:hypothetical protein
MNELEAALRHGRCRAEVLASGGEPVWGDSGVWSFLLPASTVIVIAVGLLSMWMIGRADPAAPPKRDAFVVRMVLCAVLTLFPLSVAVPALQTGIIDSNNRYGGVDLLTYRCDPEFFLMELEPFVLMFVVLLSALLSDGIQTITAWRRYKARPPVSRWRRSYYD